MSFQTWGMKKAVGLYNGDWFTRRRSCSPQQSIQGRELLRQFRQIDAKVGCLHTEKEMLVMVDFVLWHAPPGCMIECGSYLGGSTAKLSLVAAASGRQLYVCDSFEGLPVPAGSDGKFSDAPTGCAQNFRAGQYSVRREVVENNVKRFGDPSVCHYVEGFFSNTLPKLMREEDLHPAFIFADADLIASTRDVLRSLWPPLVPGGRFFTHDANLAELCEGIMDGGFWRDEIGEFPPVLFGAGHGLGFQAGGIGYCRKQ